MGGKTGLTYLGNLTMLQQSHEWVSQKGISVGTVAVAAVALDALRCQSGGDIKGRLAFHAVLFSVCGYTFVCEDAAACVYLEKSAANQQTTLGALSPTLAIVLFETGSLFGPERCPVG